MHPAKTNYVCIFYWIVLDVVFGCFLIDKLSSVQCFDINIRIMILRYSNKGCLSFFSFKTKNIIQMKCLSLLLFQEVKYNSDEIFLFKLRYYSTMSVGFSFGNTNTKLIKIFFFTLCTFE